MQIKVIVRRQLEDKETCDIAAQMKNTVLLPDQNDLGNEAKRQVCLHCSSGHLLCQAGLDAEIDRVATQYGVEERGCIVTCQVGEWLG
jgi:hypothetical protein